MCRTAGPPTFQRHRLLDRMPWHLSAPRSLPEYLAHVVDHATDCGRRQDRFTTVSSTDLRHRRQTLWIRPTSCVTTGSMSRGAPPQLQPGRGGRGCAAPCSRHPPGLTPRAQADLSQPGHAQPLRLGLRRLFGSEGGQGPSQCPERSYGPALLAAARLWGGVPCESLAGSCAFPSIHPYG